MLAGGGRHAYGAFQLPDGACHIFVLCLRRAFLLLFCADAAGGRAAPLLAKRAARWKGRARYRALTWCLALPLRSSVHCCGIHACLPGFEHAASRLPGL